jgi:hypothetical protein
MDKTKISNVEQLCSVYEYEYRKGKAKGETIIAVSNGALDFTLTPDSGLDIYNMRHKGVNIAFLSKNGMTKNTANGTFAQRFPGGFLYTCGLDAIGVTQGHVQHGTYHSLPCSDYRVFNDGFELRIEGSVETSALFGSCLKTYRTIKTSYASNKIEIIDSIKNEGFKDDNYVLLYHFNIGYPMLDEGVTIDADILKTEGTTLYAEEHKADALKMCDAALPDELVFCHTVSNGKILVMNKELGKRIIFTYEADKLPWFTEWKSMQPGDYCLGIEPATSSFIRARQYKKLKPGESVSYQLSAEFQEV